MPAKHTLQPFVLRGYIEKVGEADFFAICLTVNICARGRSIEDAQKSLLAAVTMYIDDAVEENSLSNWIPRRAPLRHYLRYLTLCLHTSMNMFLPPHDVLLMSRVVYA